MLGVRHLALAVLLSTVVVAQPQAPVLTLGDALKLAGSGNRRLLNARLEIERNQELLSFQERQRLPGISLELQNNRLLTPMDFTLQQGALGTFDGIGPIPASDTVVSSVTNRYSQFRATFAQPLTGLHKVGLQVGVQQDEVDVARQSERAESLDVGVRLRQAYYALLDNQNAQAAVRESLRFYHELERVTEEQLKERAVLKQDLLDVRARRLEQEYQLVALENGFHQQREQLNILLGRPITTAFRVEDPHELEQNAQIPLDDLLKEADQKRPALLQARLRLRQAETNREIQRADFIPDVSLAVVYQTISNAGLLPPNLAMIQLRTQWDALDFGRRDALIAAKDKEVQAAAQQLADTQAQVASEVASQYRRLTELKALEAARQAALVAAEEKQRIALARFQVKLSLTRDVLQAQADLSAARREYRKLQFDVATAVAELNKVVGRD